MLASVTVYVPHARMTDSRHKFDKLFTPDINNYLPVIDWHGEKYVIGVVQLASFP